MKIETIKKLHSENTLEIENHQNMSGVIDAIITNRMQKIEDRKEEKQNSFKELQENTNKQVTELNKSIQYLKMEVETMRKTQRETTLKIEILGKKSGTIDASISNRIQEMEERISDAEDSIENIDTRIKENAKCKKILTQNIHEFQDSQGYTEKPCLKNKRGGGEHS